MCKYTLVSTFNSPAAVHCSGVSNQLSQEYNEPHQEVGVPGLYGGHKDNENCITTAEDRCNSEGGLPITISRKHTDKDISTLHWDACGNQTNCASRPPPLTSLAGLENSGPDLSSSHLPIFGSAFASSTDRSTVVNNPIATTLLHNNFENRSLDCHRIGCFQVRLGSSLLGSAHWREMDPFRIGLPHQLP